MQLHVFFISCGCRKFAPARVGRILHDALGAREADAVVWLLVTCRTVSITQHLAGLSRSLPMG